MRTLPDACGECGLSKVACDACWHVDQVPCCELCDGHTGMIWDSGVMAQPIKQVISICPACDHRATPEA